MVDWRVLRQVVDDKVDEQFSEIVDMYPWNEAGGSSGEGGPDPDRAARTGLKAIFVMPGSNVQGEGAEAFTRVQNNDVWISITEDQLGEPGKWRRYDRVFLRDRWEWYVIEAVYPSATYRPNIHLTYLKDVVFPLNFFLTNGVTAGAPELGSPTLTINPE